MKSYVLRLPFCFNLKDVRHSTQVINHVLARAAPGGQDTDAVTYTHISWTICKDSKAQTVYTAGALHVQPLSPTGFLSPGH